MTAYSTALLHISRNAYKRGAYKGDAPADTGQRGKSHFRIVDRGDHCAVRFHNTDIIRAYENGDIVLSSNGWVNSPTTRKAFAEGLAVLGMRYTVTEPHGLNYRSHNQTVVTAHPNTYVYYDGMRFNQEGHLLTLPRAFHEKRIDREETKELAKEIADSGFKAMYALIYATCSPDVRLCLAPQNTRDKLTDADRACDWPGIVAHYKWSRSFDYQTRTSGWTENSNKTTCWGAIMADLKRSMYRINATDTFVIN